MLIGDIQSLEKIVSEKDPVLGAVQRYTIKMVPASKSLTIHRKQIAKRMTAATFFNKALLFHSPEVYQRSPTADGRTGAH